MLFGGKFYRDFHTELQNETIILVARSDVENKINYLVFSP